MKRMLFFVGMLLSMQVLSAQIITSAQVAEVKKEKKVWDKEPHEKGWRGFAEIAYTVCAWGNSGMDLMATYGYQFNNWVYVGAGGGILMNGTDSYHVDAIHKNLSAYEVHGNDGYTENFSYGNYRRHWQHIATQKDRLYHWSDRTVLFSLPLYANVRAFMLSTKVKPFFDMKLGGMIPLGSRELYYEDMTCEDTRNEYHEDCTAVTRAKYRYGGIYYQMGLGAEYRNYSLSFNYALKGYTAMKLGESDKVIEQDHRVHPATFTFNFGYSF